MSMLHDPTGVLILGMALMAVALISAMRGLLARASAHDVARRKAAQLRLAQRAATPSVAPSEAPKRRAA